MLPDELLVGGDDAAEILRPRAVEPAVDDSVTDLLVAQFLGIWGESHHSVDLSLSEKMHRFGRRMDDEIDIPLRVYSDMGRHGSDKDMVRRSQFRYGHCFSLKVTNGLDALGPE